MLVLSLGSYLPFVTSTATNGVVACTAPLPLARPWSKGTATPWIRTSQFLFRVNTGGQLASQRPEPLQL